MPEPPQERPQYRLYRARPRWPGRGDSSDSLAALRRRDGGGSAAKQAWTPKRVLKWIAVALAAWIGLSLVLFLISAQIESGGIPDSAKRYLSGGFPLTSANTTLVLGSDARVKGHAEPGANTIGMPSRSDTILLIRSGGGASVRMSIPRDTVVPIPGHGRAKINAAYAYGGDALALRTVETFLGIKINHLVEVNFANFPKLIDAMGGIDYTGGCVFSLINGGRKNGGYTLRLRSGTHHIDGQQALALARTRENRCNPTENEFTRERRQQKIFQSIKSRAISPWSFIRLPWVAWNAPQAVKSDMGGFSLLGFVGGQLIGGSAKTIVLKGSPAVDPALGDINVVSDAQKRRAVRRFLAG
jgi:LCP family protein required for cell wall assembly